MSLGLILLIILVIALLGGFSGRGRGYGYGYGRCPQRNGLLTIVQQTTRATWSAP